MFGNACSLRECVMALPAPKDCPEIPPMHQASSELAESSFPIYLLPYDIECRILGFMDCNTLKNVGATCRHFHVLAEEIAPGLLLGLYPHQRAAVRWMSRREEICEEIEHPNMTFFESPAGNFWGNTTTGLITDDPPPQLHDFKGGFLCDDPGLGKTITCIGLISRKRGTLPSPKDEEGPVTWFESYSGERSKYGFILLAPFMSPHKNKQRASKRKRLYFDKKSSSIAGKVREATSFISDSQVGSISQTSSDAMWEALDSQELPIKSNSGSSDGLWLQCELCQKWRRLPTSYLPPRKSWCCYLHPIEALRSCTISVESLDEDEDVTSFLGWVPENEELGNQENVEFYRTLITRYSGLLSDTSQKNVRGSSNFQFLLWLASRPARSFHETFSLPSWATQPPGYGKFMKEMGFEPLSTYFDDQDSFSGSKTERKLNRRPSSFENTELTKDDWVRWRRPPNFYMMLPDTEALREAMDCRHEQAMVKIFLSPATLVVVPSELVQHWKNQIFWHTTPGSMKVAIYDSKSSGNRTMENMSPQVLAWEYDVVITTFSVLSKEWNPKNPLKCSPLSQIYWQRIVIDEGHTLGSLGITNKLQMVAALKAEKRWCLTGTPAPSSIGSTLATIKSIQPIFTFFGDQSLGDVATFQEAVEKPTKFAPEVSMWRLFRNFVRMMARSSKADLRTLPTLSRKLKLLEFSESHAASYNALIDLVRFNLLTSDWYDPDHKESLLSAGQATKATAYLSNVALACNVSGNCDLQVSNKDLYESLELVSSSLQLEWSVEKTILDTPPYLPEEHPLSHLESSLCHGGPCSKCSLIFRVLFVTPCGCLLCVECTSQDRKRCSNCGVQYLMQTCEDPSRKVDNPNPKWDVPRDLIEFQPAYTQRGGEWHPTWSTTISSKCSYLIRRLREIDALPHSKAESDSPGSQLFESKAYKFKSEEEGNVPKVIVFTQFWYHGLLLEKQIQLSSSAECLSLYRKQMSQYEKAMELSRFRTSSACRVMLMDESGALGLDLSFVNYVFLMEPIENKSLEEQVISRAHRMGATRDVHVEVIAMRRSIEESILQEREPDFRDNIDLKTSDNEYLTTLAQSIYGAEDKQMIWSRGVEREKERIEAAKRSARNKLLVSLKRV